jgi:hypothetical protein
MTRKYESAWTLGRETNSTMKDTRLNCIIVRKSTNSIRGVSDCHCQLLMWECRNWKHLTESRVESIESWSQENNRNGRLEAVELGRQTERRKGKDKSPHKKKMYWTWGGHDTDTWDRINIQELRKKFRELSEKLGRLRLWLKEHTGKHKLRCLHPVAPATNQCTQRKTDRSLNCYDLMERGMRRNFWRSVMYENKYPAVSQHLVAKVEFQQ